MENTSETTNQQNSSDASLHLLEKPSSHSAVKFAGTTIIDTLEQQLLSESSSESE